MNGQSKRLEAKEPQNPLMVTLEIDNLMNLCREKLEILSPMAEADGPKWNCWDVRSKVPGYYPVCPLPLWEDKEIYVEGVGQGRVVAAFQIGGWYIPGVEFKNVVLGGHALNLRTHGREGQEGHCLWVWLDRVKLVQDTKLPPDFTPLGSLG